MAPPVAIRRWRWLGAAAVVVVLLVVVPFAIVWWSLEREAREGREQLAAAVAETDQVDPRWRWDDLEADRPPIAFSENSLRIVGEFKAALGRWDSHRFDGPDSELFLDERPANYRHDDGRLAHLDCFLDEHRDALALAVSLQHYPRGRASVPLRPDVLGTLLNHTQDCRELCFFLRLDAERLSHRDEPAAAAERTHATFHAVAGLRDEGFLISQLVRTAGRAIAARQIERLLGLTQPDEATLRKLAEHVAAEKRENLALAGFRGERASLHVLMDNLESGRVPLDDLFKSAGPSSQGDLLEDVEASRYRYFLPEDHAFLLRALNETCELARRPAHEQSAGWDRLDRRFQDELRSRRQHRLVMARLLLPALQKIGQATLRDRALLECIETALAAERFRLAHKRWPTSLDELRPTFLTEIPRDPFGGQPLRLADRDDGLVIYSVGADGRDDGGEVLRSSSGQPGDLGVRLWTPGRRNLSAKEWEKDRPPLADCPPGP